MRPDSIPPPSPFLAGATTPREAHRLLHLVLTDPEGSQDTSSSHGSSTQERTLVPVHARPRQATCVDRSWDSRINHVLMEGFRPSWPVEIRDTFTDHLYDVLLEAGCLPARPRRDTILAREIQVPDSYSDIWCPRRAGLSTEAWQRTLATYREEPPLREDCA